MIFNMKTMKLLASAIAVMVCCAGVNAQNKNGKCKEGKAHCPGIGIG